jgi:hypothetical protein
MSAFVVRTSIAGLLLVLGTPVLSHAQDQAFPWTPNTQQFIDGGGQGRCGPGNDNYHIHTHGYFGASGILYTQWLDESVMQASNEGQMGVWDYVTGLDALGFAATSNYSISSLNYGDVYSSAPYGGWANPGGGFGLSEPNANSCHAASPTQTGRSDSACFITYNATYTGGSQPYRTYLALHEQGHCLGLMHDYADGNAVMSYNTNVNQPDQPERNLVRFKYVSGHP